MKYLRKFENNAAYESATLDLPNVAYCEQENEVHYNPWTYADAYLTFVALESGTFTFTPQNNNVISYSTDNGTTWTQGNSVAVNSGDKVLWKGTMTPVEYQGIGTFSSTAEFNAQGNAMSLLFGVNFKGQTSLTGKDWAFCSLFYNTKIVNAENLSLPATTAVYNCYASMFEGCSSLETAPTLPATTLEDFCYSSMFKGCTNLTTAPELPVTTLASYCYSYMFNGCTSLTTAPELPATALAQSCYYEMFQGCTSLTEAPELPATTLASGCYYSMFYECSNLNYIKAMFTTTPSTTYTEDWVYGVSTTGTFVKNSAAQWDVSGVNGIPEGWTVETASE